MKIKNASVFTENDIFENKEVFVKDGLFSAEYDTEEIIDASACYLIPGLIDIHFHGCDGYDFCDGTKEAIQKISEYEAKNGITTICPATMTLEKSVLESIMKNAKDFSYVSGAELVGINMEGPFISAEKKGAQNPEFIHKPDVSFYNELQVAAGGLIKLVDIAPETEDAMDFIKETHDKVSISIAHTCADYETASEAFAAGARHVTHLYNAMPPFSHRAPGVIGAAQDYAQFVELICDGIHIHPSVVRSTFKMFGDDRIVLVSDSMMATGLSSGDYSLGGQYVKVVGNRACLVDGTIAGSATNLMDCLRTAVKSMHIPLESAVKAATKNPAKAINIFSDYGSIENGKVASFVLLDKELNIKQVYVRGKKFFDSNDYNKLKWPPK